MKKYAELVILLPCHSFEDFPVHHEGEAAEGLMAAYSALWHPRLLASAGKTPTWSRADDPPADVADKLIVVQTVVGNELPVGFTGRAKTDGATLVRKLHRRDEILAAALAPLDAKPATNTGGSTGPESASASPPETVSPAIDHTLVADFLALGACYLQTDLLTRRMRYLSNLDEVYFQGQVIVAAQAAAAGDAAAAREALQRSFEVLAEVRGHYYPVDNYLIDLTLVAPTTIGQSLREELASGLPINVMASGEVVALMAEREPASLLALREAISEGRAVLVGGEYREAELPLISPEEILAELQLGLAAYEQHLGVRPMIYARRRAGLTPVLPQILSKLGFTGAIHVTLDDGHFPSIGRSKTRWEGVDHSAIETLARVPLDANESGSFLSLPEKLGDSMDHDHVATMTFAHWPGQVSPFYRDLRRMALQAAVLGKFVTLDYYFAHTDTAGQFANHAPDRYRTPYLQQEIVRRQPNAISRHVARSAAAAERTAGEALDTAIAIIRGKADRAEDQANTGESQAAQQTAAERLATFLPPASATSRGVLVANGFGFARQVVVDVSSLEHLPKVEGVIMAAGEFEARKLAVVNVPAAGYAWVGSGQPVTTKPTAKLLRGSAGPKPIVDDGVLRNEHCEVTIHPRTGGIQSIRDGRTRGNRLSQQLAIRLAAPRGADYQASAEPRYSAMAVESIATGVNTPALGEVIARGQLIDGDGKRLAGYTQTTRLWAGSRVIEVQVDLDAADDLRADAWNSYYALRWAWPGTGTTDLRRSVNLGSHESEARKLEAPHYLELVSGDTRTTLLSGGLPYHQRSGERMLDTLLVVRGETARSFRMGIGIDLPQPAAAALEFLTPPGIVAGVAAPANASSWFFHLGTRNVVATHWAPLFEESAIVGFRVRVLETAGVAAHLTLRSLRDVAYAHEVDFVGQVLGSAKTEGDLVDFDLGPHQWSQLEVRFA